MSTTPKMTNDRPLLKLDELAERLGVSVMTVSRWWRTGQMPKPRRFGRRCLRWLPEEIDAWLAVGTPA